MNPILIKYFKLIKRLLPSERHATVIGLDIGPGGVKAVEVSSGKGSVQLLRWKLDPMEDGDEKAALVRVIRAFDLQSNTRPVICSVAGRGTLIRYIDMPRMSLQDLRRAFAIEADKYFPFPKDTVYTDCFILDPSSQDKRMSVLIVAARKDMVDARMKLLKDAGIEPHMMTLSPVALANAFAVLPPHAQPDAKVRAIVDIGENGTGLMIISDGMPRFNRDIFIGIGEIVKRLGNIAGLAPAEARALLKTPGNREEDVHRAVTAVMSNLVAELRLSFDYFITEKNLQVAEIILLGDGVALPGVARLFRESFDAALISWDPFGRIACANGVKKEDVRSQSGRFVTALGLALYDHDHD